MALTKCPECGKDVSTAAASCPCCGHPMMARASATPIEAPRKWSPGVAAVLSLVIPGAEQMYKGNVGSGLLWLLAVVVGYMALVIPGLILHLICILTAASGDPTK